MDEKFQKMSNEDIAILLKVFECYYAFRKSNEASFDSLYASLVKEKRARDHFQE